MASWDEANQPPPTVDAPAKVISKIREICQIMESRKAAHSLSGNFNPEIGYRNLYRELCEMATGSPVLIRTVRRRGEVLFNWGDTLLVAAITTPVIHDGGDPS